MKRVTIGMCVLFLLGSPNLAFAESLPEQCQNKQKEIDEAQANVGAVEKEIEALSAQIAALKQQRAELEKNRSAKLRNKADLTRTVAAEKRNKKRMCAPLEKCAKMEAGIEKFKAKLTPAVKALRETQKSIGERRTASEALSQEIAKIQTEYTTLGCSKLVAGETPQETIDQCHNLFSQWNAKQAELNKLKAEIAKLRMQHVRQRTNAIRHAKAVGALHAKMVKMCPFSQRLSELDKMAKAPEPFEGDVQQLVAATTAIQTARAVRLVKPKVIEKPKPAKAEKPQPKAEKPAKGQKAKTGGKGFSFGLKGRLAAGADVDAKSKKVSGQVTAEGEATTPKKTVSGKLKLKTK